MADREVRGEEWARASGALLRDEIMICEGDWPELDLALRNFGGFALDLHENTFTVPFAALYRGWCTLLVQNYALLS